MHWMSGDLQRMSGLPACLPDAEDTCLAHEEAEEQEDDEQDDEQQQEAHEETPTPTQNRRRRQAVSHGVANHPPCLLPIVIYTTLTPVEPTSSPFP